jgi:hypothetical protein
MKPTSRLIFRSFAALALLLLSLPVSAQFDSEFEPVDSSRRKMMGGAGYFSIGLHSAELMDLNANLEQEGFASFKANLLHYGGGGYGIIKNWIIGGEGHYYRNQEVVDSNRTSSLQGSNGMFKLGYVVLSKKGFYLYPVLGVGGGIYDLKLKQQDSLPTFPDIAANPGRSTHLTANGLVLDGALGMSFTPKGGVTGSGGPTLGLRIGYQLSPSDFKWKMDGDELSGGPTLNMDGMYVRLTIGGGGFGRM